MDKDTFCRNNGLITSLEIVILIYYIKTILMFSYKSLNQKMKKSRLPKLAKLLYLFYTIIMYILARKLIYNKNIFCIDIK